MKRPRLAAVTLFVLALAVRLAWVAYVDSPFDNVWSDMRGYVERALDLAYGTPDPAPEFLTFQPPGTHWVLAGEMLFVGWKNHAAFLFVHTLWGALVPPCAMLLATRVLPRAWMAWAVGLLLVVWPPLVSFSGFFSSEQIDAGLLALSAWLAVRYTETGRYAAPLGGALALAYLVRPQVLPTIAFLAAAGLCVLAFRPYLAPRMRVRSLAVAVAIVGCTMAFAAARYHARTQRFGLISDNGAMVRLFADTDYGKVRSSDEGYFFEPASKVQTGERRELTFPGYIGNPVPLERARRAAVRATPLFARLRRFAWNASLLVAHNDLWPESSNAQSGWRKTVDDVTALLVLWFACPLAAIGALGCASRPRPALVVITAHLFTAVIVAGFFYGECRYLVPYEAFLVLLAARGAVSLVARVRRVVAGRAARASPVT